MGHIYREAIYIPFDVSYHLDERLHEIPSSRHQMELAIDYLQEHLKTSEGDVPRQIRLYGLIGVYARIVGDFPLARVALIKAIDLSKERGDERCIALNLLRLAQVYQWHHQYAVCDRLLADAFARFSKNSALKSDLDFAYQYAGKYHFERGSYGQALRYFQQALTIRLRKGNPASIEATQLTLKITQQQLATQSSREQRKTYPVNCLNAIALPALAACA
jgi:tetratricopeptide (TPR) repeat protein